MKIEKIKLTKENLEKIMLIDQKFYNDDTLTLEWYLERYNDSHDAYVLINEVNKISGYIVSVPIKKELYDAIINGVLVNDVYINPKMFLNDSKYNYVISCVIDEEYRKQNYGTKLMQTLVDDVKGKLCALSVSKGGYSLANKFLKLKETIDYPIAIFVKDSE